jgi:7-cyano-7-deazaguanine synthase in queuosine biosynthesis
VPGRNLLFFGYAAAIAYRRDLKRLVGGMCETDHSGYPDCRERIRSKHCKSRYGWAQRKVGAR